MGRKRIANSEHYLNWIIGSVFAITALIQLWRMLRKKDVMEKLNKNVAED